MASSEATGDSAKGKAKATEKTGPTDTDHCPVCRQLRVEGPDEHTFKVAPAGGGGWVAWSAALLRWFERVGHQPTRVVIVSQDTVTERYSQALIGHGIAHIEASSNVYLMDESRLSADHEELLTLLGWVPPRSDHDEHDEMPANWALPLIHGDWQYLVEMIVATIVGVFGFDEHALVEVNSFGADHPCRDCSWPDCSWPDSDRR